MTNLTPLTIWMLQRARCALRLPRRMLHHWNFSIATKSHGGHAHFADRRRAPGWQNGGGIEAPPTAGVVDDRHSISECEESRTRLLTRSSEVIGRHGASGRGLDTARQFPGRSVKSATNSAHSCPISRNELGHLGVILALAGHPRREFHGRGWCIRCTVHVKHKCIRYRRRLNRWDAG